MSRIVSDRQTFRQDDRKRLLIEHYKPYPVIEIGTGTGNSELFKRGNFVVFEGLGVLIVVHCKLEQHQKVCAKVLRCRDLWAFRDNINGVAVFSWEEAAESEDGSPVWVPKISKVNHFNKIAPEQGTKPELVPALPPGALL